MNEEEIMIRAREAAIAEDRDRTRSPDFNDEARKGLQDSWYSVQSAARALRDASRPLSEIQPPDPDLIEARRIACELINADGPPWGSETARRIEVGEYDADFQVRIPLAAIKRGRELERAQ